MTTCSYSYPMHEKITISLVLVQRSAKSVNKSKLSSKREYRLWQICFEILPGGHTQFVFHCAYPPGFGYQVNSLASKLHVSHEYVSIQTLHLFYSLLFINQLWQGTSCNRCCSSFPWQTSLVSSSMH